MIGCFDKNYQWIASLFCAFLFAVLPAGCGTILTAQGADVSVTNNYGEIVGCRYLGRTISSSQLVGFGFKNNGLNSAINELRNNAAKLGANILVIQLLSDGSIYTEMTGDAYRCDDH